MHDALGDARLREPAHGDGAPARARATCTTRLLPRRRAARQRRRGRGLRGRAVGAATTSSALVRIFVRNRDAARRRRGRCPRASASRALALVARAARNTRDGSRRNIAAHYDLGNEFFRLFLDDTLMYSCGAVRARRRERSRRPRSRKLDRICEKLELAPGRPPARDRHRLGRLRDPRGARRTAAASRPRRSRASSTRWRRERVRAAGLEDRVTRAASRTTATCDGQLRQAGLDRDDRGRRRTATSTTYFAKCCALLDAGRA